MEQKLIRLFISLVAVAVIAIRIYRPDTRIDSTTLALLALGTLPWLSPVIKRFKGLGFEIEFHEQQAGHQTNEPEIARTDRVAGGASAPLPSMYADQYLVSLAKLTPIETIAAYVVTNGMVALTAAPSWLWGNFLVLLVLTPLVQWRLGVNNRSQLMLTTLGFLIWVFALGGPFALLVWWSPLVGALALATFTLIAPLLMRG